MSAGPGPAEDPESAEKSESAEERESAEELQSAGKHDADDVPSATPVDPGEVLFAESGGSWWVVAIGPVLVGAVLAMELSGPGQVHWWVLAIFFVILTGFSVIQVYAARTHTSVELTERTLRQGTKTIELASIEHIFAVNHGTEHQDWESAPALGELSGVPRRRHGIGLRFAGGKLAQAWARDDERLRTELTQTWQAVKMGL